MRTPLSSVSPQLVQRFHELGFTPSSIRNFLGRPGFAAISRGEPASVLYAMRENEDSDFHPLIATFILHRPVAAEALHRVLGGSLTDQLTGTGVLEIVDASKAYLTAKIDIRWLELEDDLFWVFSDTDASMIADHVPGKDHVLGVGAASLSLLVTTPRSPVNSVLDLGAGSGVQALGQLRHARSVTATDVHSRALDFAEATFAGAHFDVEILDGSWFEPIKNRKFDRIVANPPFVVGPPEIEHVYRDSGLDLDGATETVVRGAVDHLHSNGTAHLLGSWVHKNGESVASRVAEWIPSHGVIAWFLQRDTVDPIQYVNTWLRDESIDPRSEIGFKRTLSWLDHFSRAKVEAVGFGYVAIQRVDDSIPSEVYFEELTHQVDDYLGDEIEEFFVRVVWLREKDRDGIAQSQFYLRPGVAKESVSVTDIDSGMGFTHLKYRITRTEGPRWSHEVDEHIVSVIAGLHPEGLMLEDVATLYAVSNGLDDESFVDAIIDPVVALVRHGILLPAEITKGW
ncbi:DUF7782 domain-containing protein [Corynebacterium diphtheriae]|uniref:DUF7782 domain-containing protein n=1 Tax=Corynebacterium diphtheriae TaxID=1717 RepID=UPI0031401EBD